MSKPKGEAKLKAALKREAQQKAAAVKADQEKLAKILERAKRHGKSN